jgi:hypothetical protein
MEVNLLSKSSNLFDDQYVTYSVFRDVSSDMHCIRMHFEDYCEVILKNTSGQRWKFLSEELAWAFVHSDYQVNLYYIIKGVRLKCSRQELNEQDRIDNSKTKDLFLKLAKHLRIIKDVKTLIDSHGNIVKIKQGTKLRFMAEIHHGSQNFGSHEFSFELRIIADNSNLVANFTSNDIGKIFDNNEEVENIVHALDSSDYINLIKNKINECNSSPLESVFVQVEYLNRILDFLRGC